MWVGKFSENEKKNELKNVKRTFCRLRTRTVTLRLYESVLRSADLLGSISLDTMFGLVGFGKSLCLSDQPLAWRSHSYSMFILSHTHSGTAYITVLRIVCRKSGIFIESHRWRVPPKAVGSFSRYIHSLILYYDRVFELRIKPNQHFQSDSLIHCIECYSQCENSGWKM